MKEKLNKKEQHNLYTLFTIYRSNTVGKTNQFKHNSLLSYLLIYCASNITYLSGHGQRFQQYLFLIIYIM